MRDTLDQCYDPTVATKKPFEIDISDLDAVRSRLAEAERILETKRELVSEAQRELSYWLQVVDRLRLVAGTTRASQGAGAVGPVTESEKEPTAYERVITYVKQSLVPVRAADVMLANPDLQKRETVSWSLWKGAKDGVIQKLGGGQYARLDYEAPEQQNTLKLVES